MSIFERQPEETAQAWLGRLLAIDSRKLSDYQQIIRVAKIRSARAAVVKNTNAPASRVDQFKELWDAASGEKWYGLWYGRGSVAGPERLTPATNRNIARGCFVEFDLFLKEAIREAEVGVAEGGIPIGAVLVVDGKIVGRGHNRRIQKGSPILHGEMDCLENAGRLKPADYHRATMFTTLSPCDMCTGAILLYGIPRVVVGENKTFLGPEAYLRQRGVDVTVVNDPICVQLMETFIRNNPSLWHEDIGQESP